MKETKTKKEKKDAQVVKISQLNDKPQRDHGKFVKGHTKLGGAVPGGRWKYSNDIINQVSETLLNEIGSPKFVSGLADLYDLDKRAYYQVICLMAKIAVPTNIDINATVATRTLIDDRLAILVGKKEAPEEA